MFFPQIYKTFKIQIIGVKNTKIMVCNNLFNIPSIKSLLDNQNNFCYIQLVAKIATTLFKIFLFGKIYFKI